MSFNTPGPEENNQDKASSQDPPSQPPTEFYLFPSLPTEMRLKNLAIKASPRIIHIHANEVQRLFSYQLPEGTCSRPPGFLRFSRVSIDAIFPHPSPPPHQLLFVCWESHLLVLEKYRIHWGFTIPYYSSGWNLQRPKYKLVP
jgi:hypothetical protein